MLSPFQTVYRLLAIRCQSRLLRSQNEGSNFQRRDEAAEDLFDLLDLVEGDQNNDNAELQFENPSSISDLRAILQLLAGNAGDQAHEEAHVRNVDPEGEGMEEDDASETQDYSNEDESDSDFDDDVSVAGEERDNDSMIMEDADDVLIETDQRADDQPRTVSVSSDDL